MVSLIALIILMIGGLNWFCIGALQYDFVAGLFGSQANIFSRLVYVIVGIASIIVGYYAIKNKGKVVNFRKVKSMFSKKKEKEDKVEQKNTSNYSSENNAQPKQEHAYHEEFEDRPGSYHNYHEREFESEDNFEDKE